MAEPPLNLPWEQQNLRSDNQGFIGLNVSHRSRWISTGFSADAQPPLGVSHASGMGSSWSALPFHSMETKKLLMSLSYQTCSGRGAHA